MRLTTFRSLPPIFLASALLLSSIPAGAGDTPAERLSLRGVPSIQLLIEPSRPDAERDGLTTAQLEADIELRLRRAGIKVVPLANDVLQVQVVTVKHSDGTLYAFNASVVFYQVVVPYRHIQNQIQLPAATWSVALVGILPTPRLPEVRSHVAELVNKFISAYLEQNRRQ